MKKGDVLRILLIVAIMAAFLAPLASQWPDGLERIAHDFGFFSKEKSVFKAPFSDYRMPGLKNEFLSTAAVGIVAGFLLFAIVSALAAVVRKIGQSRKFSVSHSEPGMKDHE